MKKSELLREQADHEDNEIKAFALYSQAEREERKEQFEETLFPELRERLGASIWYDEKKSCYTIKLSDFEEEHFIIYDFYPKANKLLIRHRNQWIGGAAKWLANNSGLLRKY